MTRKKTADYTLEDWAAYGKRHYEHIRKQQIKNRAETNARAKAYFAANREEVNARKRAWYAANKESEAIRVARYRVKVRA